MKTLVGRLTYANVMATLAMFVALGGGAYAIKLKKNSVGTKQLKAGAVTERKLADNSVSGAKVIDGSVGIAEVNASLHLSCPGGTIYLQGACIETTQRHPEQVFFTTARNECGPSGRLPSVAELDALARRPGISWPGFEWTSNRSADDGSLPVTTVSDNGTLGINADSNSGFEPFRCVFEPTG